MKKVLAFLLVIVTLFNVQSFAKDKVPMDPAIRYGKLKNGMTYYIRHNEEPKDRASFYIAQNVGAILENDDQNGLAHFLEHMAFNGTKHFKGKGILNFLEKHGVRFGYNINAYTAQDETVYNLSDVPTNKEGLMDSCLLVLNDWSNYLLLTDEEIDAERGVIAEEWRTRRDVRFRTMSKQNVALLYGSKYAKRDVIGDLDVIKNFKYETLRDFYHDWYRTDLQALIIIGDFDVDKMEAKVKEMFSKIPAVKNPKERKYYTVPDHDDVKYAQATDKEAQMDVVIVFNKYDAIPKAEKGDNYLKDNYLKSMFNGMLQARISERMQQPDPPFLMAQIQTTGFLGGKDATVVAAVHKPGDWKSATRGALEMIEKVRDYGFTQGELDRMKTNFMAQWDNALKRKDKVTNDQYAKEYKGHYIDNDPIPGIEYEHTLAKEFAANVKLSDFNTLANRFLQEKNMVVVINGPEKEGKVYPQKDEVVALVKEVKDAKLQAYKDAFVDKPLIAKEPEAGKIVERKAVNKNGFEATELKLSNGIRVFYRHSDIEKEKVVFNAQSWGGTSLVEDDQLENAAVMGNFMGAYGLGDFSATELQKKLTGKIAGCGFSIGGLSEGLSGSAAPKDLETMFQLMYLRFTQPRFDGKQYMNMYPRYVEFLKNAHLDVKQAFNDSVSVTMANHHPRVKPFTKESLEKVSFDGIKKIYLERFANPGDFVFTFSGNFEVEKLEAFIEKYIASLPVTDAKETYKDRGVRAPSTDVNNHFERELETSKATVYVNLNKEFDYNQKNRIYAYVINQILDKRYVEEIREKEGGTYGVGVRVSTKEHPIKELQLSLKFDCDPEKADKLKGIALKEIDELIKGRVLDKDLSEIKKNLLKRKKESIEKLGYWHGKLNDYALKGYVSMSDADYEKFVNSLSRKSVAKAAKKLLKDAVKVEVVMKDKK